MTQYQWNTLTIIQPKRKIHRGVTHCLFACENYLPHNIVRSDGQSFAFELDFSFYDAMLIYFYFFFIKLLETCTEVGAREGRRQWPFRLAEGAVPLIWGGGGGIFQMTMCTVLLPPGGHAGDRQMAARRKDTLQQLESSWGASGLPSSPCWSDQPRKKEIDSKTTARGTQVVMNKAMSTNGELLPPVWACICENVKRKQVKHVQRTSTNSWAAGMHSGNSVIRSSGNQHKLTF